MKRKIEKFLSGYRIQFTEQVFTIATMQTLSPPTCTIKDANSQLIQDMFYAGELTRFEQKHNFTYFNYRRISLVESTNYVIGRVHYQFDFLSIHGGVSSKLTFPVYNTFISAT